MQLLHCWRRPALRATGTTCNSACHQFSSCLLPCLQAMRATAEALQRARPSAVVYDRRRKVDWALRLQQRWLK